MPIKALNTFSRDWKIQGRISQKAEKRLTNKGGSILKITIIDMYGTKIEGAFFDEAADHFDRKIQEGKIYLFSNATVKMANKKFTSIKNDFTLIFEKNAQIIEADDDGSIANMDSAFDFSTIKSLEETPGGNQRTVDILGLVIDVSEIETVKLKSNREKIRGYVTIVDESCFSVMITLWGDICEKYKLSTGDIIGISGARISDYGGKSLNAASDHADMTVNPNHERARKLSYWYNDFINKHGQDAINKIRSVTNKVKGGELPEARNTGTDQSSSSTSKKNSINVRSF